MGQLEAVTGNLSTLNARSDRSDQLNSGIKGWLGSYTITRHGREEFNAAALLARTSLQRHSRHLTDISVSCLHLCKRAEENY